MSAEDRPPSATELAAGTAACITFSRQDPDSQGVVACGTIYEVTLPEDGETVAVVKRALGLPGNHELELPPTESVKRPLWARERGRYALSCFRRALERLGA